jgi:hypothetical protein
MSGTDSTEINTEIAKAAESFKRVYLARDKKEVSLDDIITVLMELRDSGEFDDNATACNIKNNTAVKMKLYTKLIDTND